MANNYITRKQAQPGVKVVVDGGFTCIEEGKVRTISRDKEGDLYFRCGKGRHYLNGQIKGRYVIGLRRK